jgi:hypothetical protein
MKLILKAQLSFYIAYFLTGIQIAFFYGPVQYLPDFYIESILLILILIIQNINYSLLASPCLLTIP